MKLKSLVGSVVLKMTKAVPVGNKVERFRLHAVFSPVNSFTSEVPSEWWESVQELPFDREKTLKYKEAFRPL